MNLVTIFKNEHIIVVDKPSGMLCVPPRFPERNSRPIIGKILEQHLNLKIFPVHRLDFEVSGLIIYALNANSHKILSQAFENKVGIEKIYEALIPNSKNQKTPQATTEWKEISLKLVQGKKRSFIGDHGKETLTKFRLVKNDIFLKEHSISCSLFEMSPITGKRHQLRLVAKEYLNPIIGDELYGSTFCYKTDSIALRCTKLSIKDPMIIESLNLDRTDLNTSSLSYKA